jgi:hypothetical protein
MKNKSRNRYLTKTIFSILTDNKDLRDNWLLVVKEVHDREMALYSLDKKDYYNHVFSFKLTDAQTIARLWRLIQEINPALRGDEWEVRQKNVMRFVKFIKKTQLELF